MLTAIGFIAVVTAAITAAFIESARKRLEEEEGALVDPSTATLVAEVKEIASRLDRLDAKLDKLSGALGAAGSVAACAAWSSSSPRSSSWTRCSMRR